MKFQVVILALITICLLSGLITLSSQAKTVSELKVSFINVGYGDATLIQAENNFDILIDDGNTTAGVTVVNFLREQKVYDIDVLFVSHTHLNHFGGLLDVLALIDIPVQAVYFNGYPRATDYWRDFTAVVAAEGLTLQTAQFPSEYTWGFLVFTL